MRKENRISDIKIPTRNTSKLPNQRFNLGKVYSSSKSAFNMNMNEIVSLAWGAKEILRGDFKKSKYGEIILPFVILRRLEGVLQSTKDNVLKECEKLRDVDERVIDLRLNQITNQFFFNKSKYDVETLMADPNNIHRNIKIYLRAFSPNVRDIFDNFKFNATIDDLQKQKLLYQIVQHFAKTPLDPERIDNHMMGTIYEELIRRASEAANEEAGDHFTPREVIKLMVNLLFVHDRDFLKQKHLIRTIYDPAAGTGGMLSVASEYVRQLNPDSQLDAFGQELNPESYAICKSDMMLKGLDLNRIKLGNSLTDEDGFPQEKFHYMLSNPPFGVDWGKYESKIRAEAEKGLTGRYGPGLPRKSDGSLLFLLQMISKMKSPEQGGSRIAIVLNGSPLFAGEAGSGESDIRKWIIEKDLLEAIIALPDQLFYNTGISTYIWIVTNKKRQNRKGKVQLINAVSFYKRMKSSLGKKRNIIADEQIHQICEMYEEFKSNEYSKILENQKFGYTRITIERPIRRNFIVNEERLERLKHDPQFEKNVKSNSESRLTIDNVIEVLKMIGPMKVFKDSKEFSNLIDNLFLNKNFKLSRQLQKIIENALSEHDETAKPTLDKNGNPVADTEIREFENVPLEEDIDQYFKREVKPHFFDAWMGDPSGNKVGYEIPINRYFYDYKPLRSLSEIGSEIQKLEKDISAELKELMM